MMTSIDGKIEGDFIHDHNEELGDWFELQKLEDTDAWGNGSNTREKYFSDASIDLSPYAEAESPTEDHVLLKPSPYIVSFDTKGKVLWNADSLEFPDGVRNQVLVVTTRSVRPEYVAYLRKMRIPFILAGDTAIDLPAALDKLYSLFGIRRFAIVGGALGGTLGMYGFRHKTLHKTFAIGFPLLAIVQIAAVVFLVIKFA